MSNLKVSQKIAALAEAGDMVEIHKTISRLTSKQGLHFSQFRIWIEAIACTDMVPLAPALIDARRVTTDPEQRMVLDSFQAVDLWCRKEFVKLGELALKYNAPLKIAQLSQDSANALNHLTLCMRLLAWQHQNASAYGDAAERVLVAIGDSHGLVPSGLRIGWTGGDVQVVAMPIRGLKMFHLGDGMPRKYRAYLDQRLARLPKNAMLLMSVGEIDCRPDQGIFYVTHKHGIGDFRPLLDTTIGNYVAYLKTIFSSAGISSERITIPAVPYPRYNIEVRLPTGATAAQFMEFILEMNRRLQAAAKVHGWVFFDTYAASKARFSQKQTEAFLDDIHLSPEFFANANQWLRS